jgi:hypothetical protein
VQQGSRRSYGSERTSTAAAWPERTAPTTTARAVGEFATLDAETVR